MTYLAIINTPGYLPDDEPTEHDTIEEAWQYLYEQRMRLEEDSYPGEDYTDGVRALAGLAGLGVINAGRQVAIPIDEVEDGQLDGYSLTTYSAVDEKPTGWVRLRTHLPGDDGYDRDLGLVYEVVEAQEETL